MKTSTAVDIGMVLVFLAMTAIMCLGFGCGGDAPALPVNDQNVEDSQYEAEDSDRDSGPQGQLPLGYNQRQCQWDACGGPMPTRQSPALDPLRE
jgi:hypothetical protein